MPIQKRFYGTNENRFILINHCKADETLLISISDENDQLEFALELDYETALEFSREIYHSIKNLKNGGRNEK